MKKCRRKWILWLFSFTGLLLPLVSFGDNAHSWLMLHLPAMEGQPEQVASALKIVLLLTVLSLAPAILVMLTSFTRIVIVLSLLRHALGLQQTPPNIVLMSLALFLTLFTMMPVIEKIDKNAYLPYQRHAISFNTALQRSKQSVKNFMLGQTREKTMAMIIKLSHAPKPQSVHAIRFYQLIPAFMLSELQTAFEIGFVIFIPFMLIDLLVAGVLMAMGMVMVPPMSFSLPLKMVVFILVSGWDLVISALVGSFHFTMG